MRSSREGATHPEYRPLPSTQQAIEHDGASRPHAEVVIPRSHPTLPDAPVTAAAPTPSTVSSGAVPSLNVDSLPKAGTPGAAAPPSKPGIVVQAQPVTPTCPRGSTWNGSTCAGNATSCAVGMRFLPGQGCVPDVAAPATPAAVGTAAFDRGGAAAALGGVNLGSCKTAGGPVGAGHVSLTFSPDGSVSSAVVDRPPYAGTPTGTCISNLFRAVHIRLGPPALIPPRRLSGRRGGGSLF
jgi:hypothetical protein